MQVAYILSLQVGLPPLCMYPRIVALVSMPVAASIRLAMDVECPMPSAFTMI